MLDWLFASPHERRLLPGGYRGPTPFVIAIMTFAMIIVAAGGLALSNAAGLVAKGIDNRFSVQVPGGSRDLPAVLRAARSTPGILSVQAVPEAEMRKTLEQWLGPAGGSEDLPVPALVTLEIAGDADRPAIAQRIEKAAPGARFVAHEESLAPLLKSVRALQWLALSLVFLMALATSAAVVLAARGALDTHRGTIEIMHGIGATDIQVTRLFQRKVALDALAGGLFGGVSAAIVLSVLAAGGSALASDLTGGAPLDGRDLLLLALLPVLIILLATGVARVAVLAALRQSI